MDDLRGYDLAIDWLTAVRALGGGADGIAWANELEEMRAELEVVDGVEVTLSCALGVQLAEQCDLVGTTYMHDGRFYFVSALPDDVLDEHIVACTR